MQERGRTGRNGNGDSHHYQSALTKAERLTWQVCQLVDDPFIFVDIRYPQSVTCTLIYAIA